MSICDQCGAVGGYHYGGCAYTQVRIYPATTTAPRPPHTNRNTMNEHAKQLDAIRKRHEERSTAQVEGIMGGVREWTEIGFLLRTIEDLTAKDDDGPETITLLHSREDGEESLWAVIHDAILDHENGDSPDVSRLIAMTDAVWKEIAEREVTA